MVLPKFNIKPLLDELMRTDIKSVLKNARNESKILRDWNLLMEKLRLVSGKLAQGEKVADAELKIIKDCAFSLSYSAAEFGSMVPGPIGIICSVGLAIGCLIPPIDIVAFVLNILGCIPFAKAGIKAFKPILNNIIREFLNNPAVKSTLSAGANLSKNARYNKQYAQQMYNKLFIQNKSNSTANHININSIMNKSAGADKHIIEKKINSPFREGLEKQHKDLNYIPEYYTNNPSTPYPGSYLFVNIL